MKIKYSDISDFFINQLTKWELAKINFNDLKNVVERTIDVNGFPIKLQFNPTRIRSTAAKVDNQSIAQRKCFLCNENRPQEQMILDELNDYDVLINPFPIFNRHFTICHTKHIHQDNINFDIMVDFATKHKDLVTFYNASKSGASAPDHLHFQAGNKDFLPICNYIEKGDWTFMTNRHSLKIRISETTPMPFFHIRASHLTQNINSIIDSLTTDKSYRNLLIWNSETTTEILLFPRAKHRPDCYFENGDAQILVSPGAVDMAGSFILPRKEDFDKLNIQDIIKIYNEVSTDVVTMKNQLLTIENT